MQNLDVIWYFIIGLSVIFYTILDGFDLGVGMLHLFARKDEDRRVFLNAIGPVWDGNEVWLVIVGGGLFAGFPDVYATLFSGFYNLCMILLAGLIFRAAAIEFRSKQASKTWRQTWDTVFCVASGVIAFGLGLVLGNLVQGIPLNVEGDFVGTFADFFTPYTILMGFLSMALFMMHGAIYLLIKTEGPLHNALRKWVNRTILFFIVCYVAMTVLTLWLMPHMRARMDAMPFLYLVAILALLAILNIPREVAHSRDGRAFASSCLGITLLFALFGMGTFPQLVRSSIYPDQYSLTIANSASSILTLKVLLIIVAIGIPFVLAYGFYVYRVFRGKVKLGPTSY
jgi:cytochrome d ubiquinol oxidase subunit II